MLSNLHSNTDDLFKNSSLWSLLSDTKELKWSQLSNVLKYLLTTCNFCFLSLGGWESSHSKLPAPSFLQRGQGRLFCCLCSSCWTHPVYIQYAGLCTASDCTLADTTSFQHRRKWLHAMFQLNHRSLIWELPTAHVPFHFLNVTGTSGPYTTGNVNESHSEYFVQATSLQAEVLYHLLLHVS